MNCADLYRKLVGKSPYTDKPNSHETDEYVEWLEHRLEQLQAIIDCNHKLTNGDMPQ